MAFANLKHRVELPEPITMMAYDVATAAPPDEVFGVVGDPRSKLVWVPAIKRVELLSEGPPGLGVRYLTSSGACPVEFLFREQIVEWDPPRRVAREGMSRWRRFRAIW